MLLREQLEEARVRFAARVPEEARSEILGLVEKQLLAEEAFGIREGSKAADFTLDDPLGEPVTLYEELARGPVVLTFYRGGWCPFCNIQLRSYQQLLPELGELGASLIAVSPQSPDNSLSQKEKESLGFRVLSDPDGRVADCYRLLFELPGSLREIYLGKLGLDLGEYNRSERWILPAPGTFIIDREGIVRTAHVSPDFMKRMEPRDIVNALTRLR